MFIQGLVDWGSPDDIPDAICRQLEETTQKFSSGGDNCVESVAMLEELTADHLLPQIKRFEEWGSNQSPTFRFWVMFLRAVSVMLMNIRAEREGDWPMHLQSVYCMLPYFFVCNRTNYARWAPVYLLDMLALPAEVEAAFQSGDFAVRETPGRFNGIWSDLGTEKTIIRDAKCEWYHRPRQKENCASPLGDYQTPSKLLLKGNDRM